jgi:hypothetical protein
MSEKRKLNRESVGAWLVTCNPDDVYDVTSDADARLHIFSWSLAGNYRTDLVEIGDDIVLWVGGSSNPGHTPGVWAYGIVVGEIFDDQGAGNDWKDEDRKKQLRPYVPMAMTWLEPPLAKQELEAHPLLGSIEVLRMPQMANPSYLSPEEADALYTLMEESYSAPARQRLMRRPVNRD